MNTLIISASGQANSQSLRIATWLHEELGTMHEQSTLVDLHHVGLSLDMNEFWDNPKPEWQSLLEQLEQADSYVFVTPEWNGMASPSLRVLFNYQGGQMAHKPAMLVGVSSGFGGRYPLAELRASSVKNTHLVYTPEQLVVMQCKDYMQQHLEPKDDSTDGRLQDRARYALNILREYASALSAVRSSGTVDMVTYENGV